MTLPYAAPVTTTPGVRPRGASRLVHVVLGTALGGRAVAGHLALPLIVVVRGLPFLGLLLVKPGEATLVVAGAQVRDGRLPLLLVVVAAVVGALATDVLSYLAGRLWGGAALARIHARAGTRGQGALDRADRAVRERGGFAVAAARPTVVAHSVVPVLAGAAAMPAGRFVAWAMAGASVWAGLWLAGGAGLGAAWAALSPASRTATLVLAGVAAVVYGAACLLRRSCPSPLRRAPAPT